MSYNRIDMIALDSAIKDASMMAELTDTLIYRGLGFENAVVQPLDQRASEILLFAVRQTADMVKKVEEIFKGREPGNAAVGASFP